MAMFKWQQIKTLRELINVLKYMFSNLDSKNVKRLDFRETHITESEEHFKIYDDFTYQSITESNTPWVLNCGIIPQSLDPLIVIQKNGTIRFTSGLSTPSVFSNDGSQLVSAIPFEASNDNLIFEARLKINTSITGISVNIGFTDTTSLEEAFEIATSDVITSNASNGACFTYDDDATTKEWFALAVNNDTDDTDNSSTGTAPTADVFQTFRIEISADGEKILFYIDQSLVKTLNSGGIDPNTNIHGTISICNTSTTQKFADSEYVSIIENR